MTSRTNHRVAGENQQRGTRLAPSALQQRRHEALERYLAGAPIAVICREMGCSKSWLYTWKKRSQVTEPDWSQERSRRPKTAPARTPQVLETAIVRLHDTLAPGESGTVSARVIRDALTQHHIDSIPSLRTIYRILKRQTKAGNAHSFPSSV
jgi:hypothetical protein